jgi:signal transduction histidine kinase
MLLTKLQSIFDNKHTGLEFEPNFIKHAIDSAIKEYPFYKKEKELVVWDEKNNTDFTYLGDALLTKHILFNLIKNALRAIKEAEHGEIYISLYSDNQFNYLIFKDTASGIPAEDLDSVFQQFNSKSKGGSGLGLAFCKMTMQSYGGDITCDSKEGGFTVFTLSFPKLS